MTEAVVFVVDDDPSVRKSLTRVLTSAGYGVETFASAGDFMARTPFAVTALVAAVQRAVAKGVKDRGEEDRTAEARARVARLTPRETEVFALVVTGMLNKQIAGQLGVGEKTVKVHRARVMKSRADANVSTA